jgi:hypothetical protein
VRVAYIANDLSNPAVALRVMMLRAGGAEVVLLGFDRGCKPTLSVAGVEATRLGTTKDARFLSRVGSVLLGLARAPSWSRKLAGVDAILARNLEMLVLAQAARRLAAPRAALVYEVLDVHRLMLRKGISGRFLRWLERALMRRASSLIVSSPAFITNYFKGEQRAKLPVALVENKVLVLGEPPERKRERSPGPPWRIAWCGMLRCQRSLDILANAARHAPGLIEVEIYGRPADTAFSDFRGQVSASKALKYYGPYAPSDLRDIYVGAHFIWAIDYFEAGLNSDWLLPNRLYEGQLAGAVPIALRNVETGRWLAGRKAGLLLDDADNGFAVAMAALTEASYATLARRTADLPLSDLVHDHAGCTALVGVLRAAVCA